MITPLRATKHGGLPHHRLPRHRRRSTSPTALSATIFRLRPRLEAMEDRTLLSTFIVSNTGDSGPGSLRQAIVDSNAATGATNTIDFHISGTGVQTIVPLSSLPAIADPVLVDGFSQPGYSGTPLIELSGSQAGAADGFTITGSGSTIRGLNINGFASGAGIVITGIAATGNTIEANDIGTDPNGTQPLPNFFGVQIVAGASNNLVGGTTAAAGNLIAFNNGPGVDVEGDGSVGNQFTANRIFSNERGSLHFDGTNDVILPNNLISGFEQEETIEASFQTTSNGVILGYQTTDTSTNPGSGGIPALYVGTDGFLYDGLSFYSFISSIATVDDGRWHQVALVDDGQSGTEGLYLDGQLLGSDSGGPQDVGGSLNQIGTGDTAGLYSSYYYPNTNGGWFGFNGQIADVRIWSVARTAAEIQQDMTAAPSATEPGLEADYPLDDGVGQTAHDLTSNHNDGRLEGFSGDLPTWVNGSGEAIDLGNDGITHNSRAPRLGPNNYQNFPIVVATDDSRLEGWLNGSTPDTTFRIDVFASASYSPEGAGQAQHVLGSLEVTTDSESQAVFDIPFTPPANLPIVTATATDPEGNTSEISALTRGRIPGADGVCSHCPRSAAALLGRFSQRDRDPGPGCGAIGACVGNNPLGPDRDPESVKPGRPGRHGRRNRIVVLQRHARGGERGSGESDVYVGAGLRGHPRPESGSRVGGFRTTPILGSDRRLERRRWPTHV